MTDAPLQHGRIVSIGECMVEMAPAGAEPGTYAMGFAGDTLNTAWYLRRLLPDAFQVDYVTAVGTDAISDQMIGFMSEAGLGTDRIMRRRDQTVGLYMVQLQNGERSFIYWRGQSAARTLAQDAESLDEALAGAQAAYFSGITIAVLPEADRVRLLDRLSAFRSGGGQVIFDPNLRPLLWSSPEAMTTAIMDAAAVSDTVLPSYEDEATWFHDASPEGTADRYVEAGARDVIVKNGPGQILAWTDGQSSVHDPEVITEVVDTTAAGDSFNAGYLASRLRGQSIGQAVDAGAGLAAQVVQARGALVSDIKTAS